MKYFLKRMPLEFYVLVLPSIFFILLFGGTATLKANLSSFPMNQKLLSLDLLFFIPLILFGFFRFLVFIYKTIRNPQIIQNSSEIGLKTLFSLLFVCAYLILGAYSINLITSWVFQNVNIVKTIETTQKVMSLDYYIFGTYPPFVLQKIGHISHFLEVLIVNSYLNLFLFIKIFLIFAFFKKQVFRKFVMAFFMGFIISFPIWHFFPVMYPSAMYIENILKVPISNEIYGYIKDYPLTEYNQMLVERLDQFWVSDDSKFYSVSANPSMHIAWGLILVWFAFELSPYLLFVTIPWFFLQSLGTMYMFQHYATDLFFGLIVGISSIIFINFLIKLEEKYYLDDFRLLSIFQVIRNIFFIR